MKIVKYPGAEERKKSLARSAQKFKRTQAIVKPIIKKVKQKGDVALLKFAAEYDHAELEQLQVSHKEMEAAPAQIDESLKKAIQVAYHNIKKFHDAQHTDRLSIETTPGVRCERKSVPIQKVGLYVPGGTAPLFSSVLMLGIPAKLAGCEEIVICTPPNRKGKVHPAILYAAHLVGIDKIFKVGGAQAVAAMAYGTESVPKVYKIFGPGNQYVTVAKQLLTKKGVAIDMPAGPSEVAVYSDASTPADFVASDLLSQAEHGVDSQVIFVTTDKQYINEVNEAVYRQLDALPRKDVAVKALENSAAILVRNHEEAIDLLNEYGAEHLIISTANARAAAEEILNAGSIFIGPYTPEAAGDYASGTNHTLPTNGYARAYSGVSLDSFFKKITLQEISAEGIQQLGPHVEVMAEAEALRAHKNAVSLRLAYLEKTVANSVDV